MPPLALAPCTSGRAAPGAAAAALSSARPPCCRSSPGLATARRQPHHLLLQPPVRAQVGEPSKRPSSGPATPSPGAPPPGGGKKEKDTAAESADAAAAAATDYAEGVARVAEEGISEAGDVAYAARADAIAAERKAAEGEALSEDDIRRLAALRRSGATSSSGAPSPADSGSLLQGVLEEARLIEWPTFGRAVGDTAVVLAIVAASAAVLFAINTALTEVSALIY